MSFDHLVCHGWILAIRKLFYPMDLGRTRYVVILIQFNLKSFIQPLFAQREIVEWGGDIVEW